MANYAFLLTRGRGQTEWSTSVDNKENPKIQISNRNVCPGKINRERKKIIKKIITYRITTPPQSPRKTNPQQQRKISKKGIEKVPRGRGLGRHGCQ